MPAIVAGAAGTLLFVLLVVVLAAGALLVFVALAGLVSGPFCERLSETVDEIITGTPSPPFRALHYAKRNLARGAGHALRRIIVTALLGALLLFALSFVPVIGTLAAIALGAYFCIARVGVRLLRLRARGRREHGVPRAKHASPRGASRALARPRRRGRGSARSCPVVNLVALGVGAIGAATLAMHDLQAAAR